MDNEQLIQKFHTAFAEGHSKKMIECYHTDGVSGSSFWETYSRTRL